MFNELYAFFYEWLFAGVQPSYLSEQGAEFACIVFSCTVLIGCVALAFTPIKMLIRFIFKY